MNYNLDNECLAAAIESSGSPFAVTDTKSCIAYANAAFCTLSGYSREDLLGQPMRMLKSGYTENETYSELWETILAGGTWHGVITNRRKDGTLFTQSLCVSPVRQGSSSIRYFSSTWQDITAQEIEKLKVERELRALRKFEESFEQSLMRIAHDLRTPLGPVVSISSLLESQIDHVDPQLADLIPLLSQAAERMERLLAATLDIARIREGALKIAEVDLNETLDAAVADLAWKIKKAGAAVRRDRLPTIAADPILMYEVFGNLIENALKFRKDETPLSIDVRDESEAFEYRFVVQDNGIGIDESMRERVLLPFERADRCTRHEGVGMGLPICCRILRQHGGELQVESALGLGTTFRIVLPRNR